MAPAISPDGKWVAYLSDARGPTDVWTQFVGGGQPINLTANANLTLSSRSVVGGLEISPDGSRILFQAGPSEATNNATYSVPAPLGGLPSRFLENGVAGVRWSPDGRRIVFVLAGSSAGDALWIADADGSNRRLLVRPEGNVHAHWPSWSADGRYCVLQSLDHGVERRTDRGLSSCGGRWRTRALRRQHESRRVSDRNPRRSRPDLCGESNQGGPEPLVASGCWGRPGAPDDGSG